MQVFIILTKCPHVSPGIKYLKVSCIYILYSLSWRGGGEGGGGGGGGGGGEGGGGGGAAFSCGDQCLIDALYCAQQIGANTKPSLLNLA